MKPILFNTEMVQAILEGRKTQTRRVLAPQPEEIYDGMYCDMYNKNPDKFTFWTKDNKMCLFNGNIRNTAHWKPKYKVSDILYVKETFRLTQGGGFIIFKAGENNLDVSNEDFLKDVDSIKWQSAVHLTKEYARIFLKVTNVRVERLQDVTLDDIEKEGWSKATGFYHPDVDNGLEWWESLWNPTVKDGYKWEDNPYVFVYEFERVENER